MSVVGELILEQSSAVADHVSICQLLLRSAVPCSCCTLYQLIAPGKEEEQQEGRRGGGGGGGGGGEGGGRGGGGVEIVTIYVQSYVWFKKPSA